MIPTSAFVAVALTILSATCRVHAAVQFEPALDPLAYPSGLTATRKMLVGSGSYGTYNQLVTSGSTVSGAGIFGLAHTSSNNAIRAYNPSSLQPLLTANGSSQLAVSSGVSFQGFGTPSGAPTSPYGIYAMEDNPSSIYLLQLQVQGSVGSLQPATSSSMNLAQSPTLKNGLWKLAGGAPTTWGSWLLLEGRAPNGVRWHYELILPFPLSPLCLHSPYAYGWPLEVLVPSGGNAVGLKRYAMSRLEGRAVHVLDDGVTAYITSTSGVFYMFKADNAQDLSTGTLFAASMSAPSVSRHRSLLDTTGRSLLQAASNSITWIRLGTSDATSAGNLIPNTVFSQIFSISGANCTNIVYRGVPECLTIKPGMNQAALVLEPGRLAAMLGATTDTFTFSGMTASPTGFFLASVQVTASSVPGQASNPCGCIFSVAVDANNVAQSLSAVACGSPESVDPANVCSQSTFAGPTSLQYIAQYGQIFVGMLHIVMMVAPNVYLHENAAIWSVDLTTSRATRIGTGPYGSSATSVRMYSNVAYRNYLGAVFSHPYRGSIQTPRTGTGARALYLGPVPLYVGGENAHRELQIQFEPSAAMPSGYSSIKDLPLAASKFTYHVGLNSTRYMATAATSGPSATVIGDSFQYLIREGDVFPTFTLGAITDSQGKSVDRISSTNYARQTNVSDTSSGLGPASLITTCGSTFLVLNSRGATPGSVSVHGVTVDPAAGTMSVVNSQSYTVDFSRYGGLWNPGPGMVTPWTTHLSGETQDPDARILADATCILTGSTPETCLVRLNGGLQFNLATLILKHLRYFDVYYASNSLQIDDMRALFKREYGYQFEVVVDQEACVSAEKRFAMGRFGHGQSSVMPDNRTVYMSDEELGGGFFKFVANTAGDLRSGSLYAAKITQQAASNNAITLGITWLPLGSSSDAQLSGPASTMGFYDIFSTAVLVSNYRRRGLAQASNPSTSPDIVSAPFPPAMPSAPATPAAVSSRAASNFHCPAGFTSINSRGTQECLAVKPGMEMYAAFFETRRYASLMGATMELSDFSGLALDPDFGRLVLAFSRVEGPMTGASVSGVTSYTILLSEDTCAVDPQTGLYATTSCTHNTNSIWALDTTPNRPSLFNISRPGTRMLSAPAYTGLTGLNYQPNLLGNGYLLATLSSPYNARTYTPANGGQQPQLAKAVVGYIGPFTATSPPISNTCYRYNTSASWTCPLTPNVALPSAPPPAAPPPGPSPAPPPSPPAPAAVTPAAGGSASHPPPPPPAHTSGAAPSFVGGCTLNLAMALCGAAVMMLLLA
ncbi:MAG: hypothetical protein WDW38_004665 [Sanguina aurantia]